MSFSHRLDSLVVIPREPGPPVALVKRFRHTNLILRMAKTHIFRSSQPWRNREIWVVP